MPPWIEECGGAEALRYSDEVLVAAAVCPHPPLLFPELAGTAAAELDGLRHFIKRYNYTNNVVGSVNLINAAV
ncbi:hypothetical protein ACFQ08_44135, partial [Streptosporangium algeriense]